VRRSASLVVLVLTTLVAGAAAEERLGEVVVTAPAVREEPRVRDPTAAATVIDTTAAPAEVETLAEALGESVGVQVRRFGGLGDFATVSVRGSSPGQVQVYLDGVPLSRADTGVVNLSDLPLDVVDHVEVYRGTTPLAFAQAGAAGVVNVVTRRPEGAPTTAASASYGSFTTRKVDLLASGRRGPWDYLAFGNYLGSAGDFEFTNDLSTPFNPADDQRVRRQNNAFDQGDVVTRVGYRPEGPLTAAFTADTFAKEQGVPGVVGQQALHTSLGTLRQLGSLDATVKPVAAGMPLDIGLGTYVLYQRRVFDDPQGEISQFPEDLVQNDTATGGQALVRTAIGVHQVPGLLLAVGHERFAETDRLHPTPAIPDRTRLRGTIAAEDEILLLADRLSLVPAVRFEILRDEFAGDPRQPGVLQAQGVQVSDFTSPHLGLGFAATPNVTLLGNLGRYPRPPTLQELFGSAGVVVGNPTLQPEVAFNRDVAVRLTAPPRGPLSATALEVGYFNDRIDDLIVLTLAGRVYRPANVGRASVQGEEVSARGRLWERLSLTANYTHQDATNESDAIPFLQGARLPGRPADEAYGRVELTWSPAHPLPLGAAAARLWPGSVYFDANVIANNFLDVANEVQVPARTLFGTGVAVTLPVGGIRLALEVKNLTNDETRDVLGFPLPGRSVFGTVSVGFGGREAEPQ
jgi:outer membrane receptor protein involved in Fe transport